MKVQYFTESLFLEENDNIKMDTNFQRDSFENEKV